MYRSFTQAPDYARFSAARPGVMIGFAFSNGSYFVNKKMVQKTTPGRLPGVVVFYTICSNSSISVSKFYLYIQ